MLLLNAKSWCTLPYGSHFPCRTSEGRSVLNARGALKWRRTRNRSTSSWSQRMRALEGGALLRCGQPCATLRISNTQLPCTKDISSSLLCAHSLCTGMWLCCLRSLLLAGCARLECSGDIPRSAKLRENPWLGQHRLLVSPSLFSLKSWWHLSAPMPPAASQGFWPIALS